MGLLGWLRVLISIHALLAESDGKSNKLTGLKLVFLSTLSLRRATSGRPETRQHDAISIHALLAESDAAGAFPVILII